MNDKRMLETVEMELLVDLTEEELKDRSGRLAQVRGQAELLADEKRSALASFNSRAREFDALMSALGAAVRQRKEPRRVRCQVVGDFLRGVAETLRTDTNEIVHSRPLTMDETQEPLLPEEADPFVELQPQPEPTSTKKQRRAAAR